MKILKALLFGAIAVVNASFDVKLATYDLDSTDKDPTKNLDFAREKQDLFKDCKIWFDGCNTCKVENGRLGRCSRKFCRKKKRAYCKVKEVNADNINEINDAKPATTLYTKTGQDCQRTLFKNRMNIMRPWPENCKVYQGKSKCWNFEMTIDGKRVISCEKVAGCDTDPQTPQCVTTYTSGEITSGPAAETADLSKCLVQFDGCNTCPVVNGVKGTCTELVCSQNKPAYCKIRKPIIGVDNEDSDNNNGDTLFETTGSSCDDVLSGANVLDPWPENCEVYSGTNACNKYQMVPDGSSVISCYKPSLCVAVVVEPFCDRYYTVVEDETTADEELLKIELEGCLVWFDGCNKCKVNDDSTLGTCSTRTCSTQKPKKCKVRLPPIKSTDVNSYDYQKEQLLKCKVWFNGCNTCQVKYGKITSCTKRECPVAYGAVPTPPSCTTPLTAQDLITIPDAEDVLFEDVQEEEGLDECKVWFDGCNNCDVKDGNIMSCSTKFCKKMKTPRCAQKIQLDDPLDGCTQWNDGCSDCTVTSGLIDPDCVKTECSTTRTKAYCTTFQGNFQTPITGVAQDYLMNCETWFDGCNECSVLAGIVDVCTLRYCEKNKKARCIKKVPPVGGNDSDIPVDPKVEILSKCATWFNGCNTCQVKDGELTGCTRNKCKLYRKPFCKQKINTEWQPTAQAVAQADCGKWFDGCNTCKLVSGVIDETKCTNFFCGTYSSAWCLKKPAQVQPDVPKIPKGCIKWNDGCRLCKIKNGKPYKCPLLNQACSSAVTPVCETWKPKSQCQVYYDGCNFCYFNRKREETCTENVCVTNERGFCMLEQEAFKEKINTAKVQKWDRKDKNMGKKKFRKAPPPEAFIPEKSSEGNLSCDMDGLTGMVQEILSLVFLLVTFYIETYGAIMPENLGLAAQYINDGLKGAGKWSGYLSAGLYFTALELEYGEEMCNSMGYGYYIIDALNNLVDVSGLNEKKKSQRQKEYEEELVKVQNEEDDENQTLTEGKDMFAGGIDEEYNEN